MNDLDELLATRAVPSDAVVPMALRDGLAADPAASGPAFRRCPEVARELLAMLEADGEHQAAALMRSIVDGRPRPTGALAAGAPPPSRPGPPAPAQASGAPAPR